MSSAISSSLVIGEKGRASDTSLEDIGLNFPR